MQAAIKHDEGEFLRLLRRQVELAAAGERHHQARHRLARNERGYIGHHNVHSL